MIVIGKCELDREYANEIKEIYEKAGYPVFILSCVTGEGIEELEPHLNIGDRLQFLREPDNPYDKQAIVIRNKDGVKIGYVPRSDNVIFSRLMDAGKILFGEITEKKWKGKWLDMKIRIYLHE